MLRSKSSEDDGILDQVIQLQHEALRLAPEGHIDRATSCTNLAISLKTQYQRFGDDSVLDQTIDLQREALSLLSVQHTDRATCCGNLASSLRIRYKHSSAESILCEIFTLEQEAAKMATTYTMWRCLCGLAWVYIQIDSNFYDVNKAISCLSRSLEQEHDSLLEMVQTISARLNDVWDCWAQDEHSPLTHIYQRLVDLLPLLANSTLGIELQLQALKGSSHVGFDAFVNAALTENLTLGLEIMELA
jgi:hypothetical protein